MTLDDIRQHETAIATVSDLLPKSSHGLSMRQSKKQAEIAIRPLGTSNIAYLLGKAIDMMPREYSSAGRRIDLAKEQLEGFKRNV